MEEEQPYYLMQYNILHQKENWGPPALLNLGLQTRAENLVRVIREASPDILALAERHDEWAAVGTGETVDLGVMLGGAYAFAEDRIEDGTVVNRTPILYRSDVFRCRESGSFRLGEEVPFATSQNKRVVSYAVLEDIRDFANNPAWGRRIIVFATHWSSGQPQETVNAQASSTAQAVATVLQKEDYGELPVILAADFNVPYANEAYQALLATCGLADADHQIRGEAGMDTGIVDHIAFLRCSVSAFTKITSEAANSASDHHPICCQIKIGG